MALSEYPCERSPLYPPFIHVIYPSSTCILFAPHLPPVQISSLAEVSFSGNAFVLKKDPKAVLDASDAGGAKKVIAVLIQVRSVSGV